jgi:hypothetical protein
MNAFKRKEGPLGVIGETISSLFGMAFTSIFILVGVGVFLGGYINMRDYNVYKDTPIQTPQQFEAGEIIKSRFQSNNDYLVKSEYSGTPCVYYNIDYIEFYRDSEGDLSRDYNKNIKGPELLHLTVDNQNYEFSTIDPVPQMAYEHTITYIYNPQMKQYQPTTETRFDDGDEIIEESMILPGENIIVFGRLDDIIQMPQGAKRLQFSKADPGSPFKNPLDFIKKFINIAFTNKLSLYVISSEAANADLGDKSNMSIFMMIFGLIFCGIPAIIFLACLLSLIKAYVKLL